MPALRRSETASKDSQMTMTHDTAPPTDTTTTAVGAIAALPPGQPAPASDLDPHNDPGSHLIAFHHGSRCLHAGAGRGSEYVCRPYVEEVTCLALDDAECRFGCEHCEGAYSECIFENCEHTDLRDVPHCEEGHLFVPFSECQAKLFIENTIYPDETFSLEHEPPELWKFGEINVWLDEDGFEYHWSYA